MKKLFYLLTLFIFLSHLSNGQEAAVREVFENQKKTWNNGDLLGFMDGYWKNDSLVFLGPDQPRYGWDSTYQVYKNAYPIVAAMGTLDFDILKVTMLSNVDAHVFGIWRAIIKEKPKQEGYFTILLHKFQEGWKIVIDHYNFQEGKS